MRRSIQFILAASCLAAACCCSRKSAGMPEGTARDAEALYAVFLNPGPDARPRVWWHWMQGNITKDGIRKDLEWMKRVGIAGFQNFDAGLSTPQIVDRKLEYMTPEWKDAFRFTTELADSLGLEMAIAASPGWSQSGGPWVRPADGMKKIVWREVRVEGGQKLSLVLPEPYRTTGVFQNIGTDPEFNMAGGDDKTPHYYEDIAVMAVKLAPDDAELHPVVTSSGGAIDAGMLCDGDISASQSIPDADGNAYVQFDYGAQCSISALSVAAGETYGLWGAEKRPLPYSLWTSDDGKNFEKAFDIPAGSVALQTISFEPLTARFFRVVFARPQASMLAAMFTGMQAAPVVPLTELRLYPVARVNHSEEKAGFGSPADLACFPTPDARGAGEVVDVTSSVKDGVLAWDAPEGSWNIIRFGYSLTGHQNSPASPEATGLEVDKMDRDAVDRYFEHYLGMYEDATGGLMGKRGLQYIVTDSYEAGQENWTPSLPAEFKARRGYDMMPWLPAVTGQIVKSSAETEQFLRDWRKTLGELVVDNYYHRLADILKERDMGLYSESHENGRVYLTDGMDVKRQADIPMAAMWCYNGSGGSTYPMAEADIRESASVAHIYGQNIVAAESMTTQGMSGTAWSFSPALLKPTADLEFASGLNRIVVHTSVHQPSDEHIPGLGLMIFGQWFTRHETWAEQARAWVDYLARTSAMLKQGRFAADVAYYYGDDNCVTGLFGHELPAVPEGYSFDFFSTHALVNMLSVKKGKLVTPTGMEYSILALDRNASVLSPEAAAKIERLRKAGATVVMPDESMADALAGLGVKPDFSYTAQGAKLMGVHRTLPCGEIYWVNNRESRCVDAELHFRTSGFKPAIWHAEDGSCEEVSYSIEDGITTVRCRLVPNDAVFVVFTEKTTQLSYEVPEKECREILAVEGPWKVKFQENRGAPSEAAFATLESFTANADPGIKFFSGTATYTNEFNLPAAKEGERIVLDLGEVRELAEVKLNGRDLGIVWHAPFVLDITDAAAEGRNFLEVAVTDLWRNRLIGDTDRSPAAMTNIFSLAAGTAPGKVQRNPSKVTYTTLPFFASGGELFPAGLLGPVRIYLQSCK